MYLICLISFCRWEVTIFVTLLENMKRQLCSIKKNALKKLPFARLQVLVKAANNGKGTKSYADGQQFLINYVKKNCVCV